MKTYAEYKPQLKDASFNFTFPKFKTNKKGYLAVILITAITYGISTYTTINRIKKYEKEYAKIENVVYQNLNEIQDIQNQSLNYLKIMGYEEKEKNETYKKLLMHTLKSNQMHFDLDELDLQPFTVNSLNIWLDEQKKEYIEAQEIIKNSKYKGLDSKQVPDFTDDGKAYLDALATKKPSYRKSKLLEAGLTNAYEQLKTTETIKNIQKQTNNEIYTIYEKFKAREAELEKIKKERELKQKKHSTDTENFLSTTPSTTKRERPEKPKPVIREKPTLSKPVESKPIYKVPEKPKNNDVPSW